MTFFRLFPKWLIILLIIVMFIGSHYNSLNHPDSQDLKYDTIKLVYKLLSNNARFVRKFSVIKIRLKLIFHA